MAGKNAVVDGTCGLAFTISVVTRLMRPLNSSHYFPLLFFPSSRSTLKFFSVVGLLFQLLNFNSENCLNWFNLLITCGLDCLRTKFELFDFISYFQTFSF